MQNPLVKNGILLGVISIILTLAFYLISPAMLISYIAMGTSLVIMIALMVKSIKEFKSSNNGYASFGEALIQGFGTVLIGMFISTIFTYLLYNVIDTGLSDVMMQATIEKIEGMEGMIGEEAVEKIIEDTEAQGMEITVGKLAQTFALSSVLSLIISLIVAAITKKNKTGFDSLDEVV